MKLRAAVTLAGAGALAIPAIVIGAGVDDGGDVAVETGDVLNHTIGANGGPIQVSSNEYRTIPGLLGNEALADYEGTTSASVSLDMRSGEAMVRILAPVEDTALDPGPVLASGKGMQSFHFVNSTNSSDTDGFRVQWKAVGNEPAKAAAATVTLQGDLD